MMKGQFFIISSVIMVYIIILTFQYLSSFNDIGASKNSDTQGLSYIPYIKDTLNRTVYTSLISNDCSRLSADLNYTRNFLKSEMMKRGVNLAIYYVVDCNLPVNVQFNFTATDRNLYSFTNFTYR
jgi:hypothetical protein